MVPRSYCQRIYPRIVLHTRFIGTVGTVATVAFVSALSKVEVLPLTLTCRSYYVRTGCLELFGGNSIRTHERPKGLWNQYGAVSLLIILHNRHPGTSHCQG